MKSCCEENGHDCLQGRDCPVYQQRRRVRAGQPAPPILLDPVEVEVEEDEEQLSDTAAMVAVVVIILVVAACAALVVGVLP